MRRDWARFCGVWAADRGCCPKPIASLSSKKIIEHCVSLVGRNVVEPSNVNQQAALACYAPSSHRDAPHARGALPGGACGTGFPLAVNNTQQAKSAKFLDLLAEPVGRAESLAHVSGNISLKDSVLGRLSKYGQHYKLAPGQAVCEPCNPMAVSWRYIRPDSEARKDRPQVPELALLIGVGGLKQDALK
jgi:hypothetical protein